MRDHLPKVLCIAPFNNPHIIPVYDAFAKTRQLNVRRASLRPLAQARIDMGWEEMDSHSSYLQPWRRRGDRFAYARELWASDIVIFPGFFHFRTLPFHHWLRRLTGRKSFLWSESFKYHPRTLSKPRSRILLEKYLLMPCNTKKVSLLAIGQGSEEDYREMGMSRWNYRQFVFSVLPPSVRERKCERKNKYVRLVFCGSLCKRKGVDLLVKAICGSSFLKEHVHLTLIGDGPLGQDLERACKDAGIQETVSFCGSQPQETCYSNLLNQDVLVLPSRFDGWGAVVNEAMEAGLAVIVSDRVGARRPLVQHGSNGYVFANDSVEGLQSAIENLVNNRELLKSMKTRSLETIKLYRPKAIANSLLDLCISELNGDNYEGKNGILCRC